MKKIHLNILLLLFSSTLLAQIDRSKMPEPTEAPKVNLGTPESFTLENGLKVFVVENHKLPRVAFSLQLDIDPVQEGDKIGAADLAGDLLSKGTKNRSKEELNFAVDFIGARFFTSATSIFGSSLKKHQNTLLEIMADVVKNPDFKEEELKKLKTQYISGIQTEKDDPDAIARKVRRVLLYGKDHPYGEIMTEETVENVNLEDTKNFYNTYFKPNVSYMAVVGDINLEEAKKLMKQYFGDWEKGDVPTHDYEFPEQPKVTEIAFVNKPGAVQSVVSVFNPIDLKPGSPDAIKARVTNGILGGGFVSKLNLNLREENAYTYGARSSISTDELVGSFSASAKVRNEVTDSALTEMLNETLNMQKGEVTEDELETMKSYLTGTFAIGLENPQTIARFAINIDKYELPEDYYQNYLKNVAAVSLQDVEEISKKYIDLRNGYILIVGNQEEVSDKIKKFSQTGMINYYDTYGNEAKETTLEPVPEGVDAEKVINAYIESIGGEKRLNKIKTLKIVMKAEIQGMNLTQTVIYEKPDKYFQKLSAGEQVFQKAVYDGKEGLNFSMQGGEKMMDEEELEQMKTEALPFPELAYTSEGYELNLKGIDSKYNQEKAYVIEVTQPSGDKTTHYYSVESGLKLAKEEMVESPQGNLLSAEIFKDYQQVKKIMFPHASKESQGPMTFDVKVEEIKINQKFDESVFQVKK
mgnify:CR=1 FL=1